MKNILVIIALQLLTQGIASAQIAGRVLDGKTRQPVARAWVVVGEMWAVTDAAGAFAIAGAPRGRAILKVWRLGYVEREFAVTVATNLELLLDESTLRTEAVTVLARRRSGDATTSYVIDRTALDHLQAVSVTDIAALLPGGQTTSASLIGARRFGLRTGLGAEDGNASFGTAVEVDGVRLSSNASMADTFYGADVRNVASSNVESVEVITGVPSVEHGDLNNGVVKIRTIKGYTPLTLEFVTKLNTKQYAIGKGLSLGARGGTLNLYAERARSISDPASPFTAYGRNTLSLNYGNTRGNLKFDAGVTAGVGGYDSHADPDRSVSTFDRMRDNTLRATAGVNWLLNRPWITSLEASMAASYNDRFASEQTSKFSASATAALHGTDQGYHSAAVMIPAGEWLQLRHDDSKQLSFAAKTKVTLTRRILGERAMSRTMLGLDFSTESNRGAGVYYADPALAPTWRARRYSELPWANNLAIYGEERVSAELGATTLQLTAGVRGEWLVVAGSDYGTVGALSPRLNLKWDIGELTLRAGTGKAVKLPSFGVLYPSPSYIDTQVFAGYEGADLFQVFFSYPLAAARNPQLRWQRNRLNEVGVDLDLKGVKVQLSLFSNRTIDPYVSKTVYTPYTYRYTNHSLESISIPVADRAFSVDRETGMVTVRDKTGALPAQTLNGVDKIAFKGASTRDNGSPIVRRGVEWVVDFGLIKPLRTSVRVDGKYYYYKSVDQTIYAASFASGMADGSAYPFIAYYRGTTSGTANGSTARNLNTNITFTTHIPEVRLIVSLRVESTLSRSSRYIGAMEVVPLYYTSHADPFTKIPFAATFEWAAANDPVLHNLLARMVVRENYGYKYNANRLSPYFSANVAVTKEIGRVASLTFTAKVRSSWTDTRSSLYGSGNIPLFYYGLSLRLKL